MKYDFEIKRMIYFMNGLFYYLLTSVLKRYERIRSQKCPNTLNYIE